VAPSSREVPTPFVAVTSAVKKRLWFHTDQEWSHASGMRQSKMFITRPSAVDADSALRLCRSDLRLFTQAITGHGLFRRHMALMGLTEDSLCRRCCLEDEDAAHIICRCPVLLNLRLQLTGFGVLHVDQTSELRGCVILRLVRRFLREG
jgi:hypothetical protein